MKITEGQLRHIVKKLFKEQIGTNDDFLTANFELVPNLSYVEHPYGPYRGYTKGQQVYQKRNHTPVTPQDIAQLKNVLLHTVQSGNVNVDRKDPTKAVFWFETDSTD